MQVDTLQFDEEITLDHSSMPKDDTEGAQYRDIQLSELLHDFETDEALESILDLADVLQGQGL